MIHILVKNMTDSDVYLLEFPNHPPIELHPGVEYHLNGSSETAPEYIAVDVDNVVISNVGRVVAPINPVSEDSDET